MPAALIRDISIVFSFAFLLCFFPCVQSIDVQGQALLAWKTSLGSSGDVLASWDPSHPTPCRWFGVSCNSNGGVTGLSLKSVNLQGSLPSNFAPLGSLRSLVLSSANLTGTIPKELGDYRELRFVDFSENSLTGEIPVEICWLRNLEGLYLNSNSLEGGIPAGIGNLSSLIYLTLYDNQLGGEIPRSIGAMSRLQVFRAGGNKNLKGQLPEEIGNCTELVTLGLAETSLSGSLPTSIGKLRSVQTIAIYTTLISGPIPEDIGNCIELQNLYLYQNSLSGSLPRRLGELSKLQSMLLWQNSLVGSIPDELGSCSELTVIDLSENLLTGSIPRTLGRLLKLQELQLSVNQLSGAIPSEITNCTSLTHLEVDNNDLSGGIPDSVGNLRSLTLLFAWQNKLTGAIPGSLSGCQSLQAVDLSYNNLTGSIPKEIFGLQNLTKLLLLANDLSGFIPPDIGNCSALYRVRLSRNRLSGTIPSEIGKLKALNFLDLSANKFVGGIPPAISGCDNLEFLDVHSNGLTGTIPDALPGSLQFVDLSDNRLAGELNQRIGSLTELTKLNLGKNVLSGSIPGEILSCRKLQMLDLSSNSFSGEIPKELGLITSLEISLNLSCNRLTGVIPAEFTGLTRLGILDLSHNNLGGNLKVLAGLQNLVSLNVSFNDFTGELPDTPFFKKLPLSDLTGNQALYISNGAGVVTPADPSKVKSSSKLLMSILVAVSAMILLITTYILYRHRISNKELLEDETWQITLYQKLELSIDDIIRNLTSANVIGTGSSGVVYRVMISSGETLAVKKMWSSEESGAFDSEIRTLGSIRHKNIVRLLGWCSNNSIKLLFYDYLPNGSLSSVLHGATNTGKPGGGADWEDRYDIVLGVAYALAYLHHDCVPAILHGDVKAMNVLLGPRNEPYLADFGLARTVSSDKDILNSSQRPYLAGSYGYMAPEHALTQNITEKSDVYSFGVVLLEVLTGRHPLDPTLPGGANLVQWVRNHLAAKQDLADILDSKLRGRADPAMHEMLQTLAVSFLCVSLKPDDRPMMKDVVAMLKEIRHVESARPDVDFTKSLTSPPARASPLPKPRDIAAASLGSSSCSFAFSQDSL